MKHINLLIGMVAICLLFSCKKGYEDGTYAPPTFLKISGSTSVAKNAAVTYATYYLDDATYEWTVSGDAAVTAGQGTSKVTVKFGTQNAAVSVKAKTLQASVNVTVN